jgi:hypothetical protein
LTDTPASNPFLSRTRALRESIYLGLWPLSRARLGAKLKETTLIKKFQDDISRNIKDLANQNFTAAVN